MIKSLRQSLMDRVAAKLQVQKPVSEIDAAKLRLFSTAELENAVKVHVCLETMGRTFPDLVVFIEKEKAKTAVKLERSKNPVAQVLSRDGAMPGSVVAPSAKDRNTVKREASRKRLLSGKGV